MRVQHITATALHKNVIVETSLPFDSDDILGAIEFLTLHLTANFGRAMDDEITFVVRNELGSNRVVSVIPLLWGSEDEKDVLLSALTEVGYCLAFGIGSKAEAEAWKKVCYEWGVPKHVNYDSAMVLANPGAGCAKQLAGHMLLSGWTTVLVAPGLVFCGGPRSVQLEIPLQ